MQHHRIESVRSRGSANHVTSGIPRFKTNKRFKGHQHQRRRRVQSLRDTHRTATTVRRYARFHALLRYNTARRKRVTSIKRIIGNDVACFHACVVVSSRARRRSFFFARAQTVASTSPRHPTPTSLLHVFLHPRALLRFRPPVLHRVRRRLFQIRLVRHRLVFLRAVPASRQHHRLVLSPNVETELARRRARGFIVLREPVLRPSSVLARARRVRLVSHLESHLGQLTLGEQREILSSGDRGLDASRDLVVGFTAIPERVGDDRATGRRRGCDASERTRHGATRSAVGVDARANVTPSIDG